jgi:response regulator receiver protein
VHEGFYYPMLSGVARSVNFYPIGKEKPEDGIVNLAFGLGKTVVDGGGTLRFSPKFPKKILQLSDPKMAMRDTQKTMYALDLRPGAFKISKNDGINLANMPVGKMLQEFDYPELVASTFSIADSRMVPGVSTDGPRIVTFDYILKYGRFPLAQILADVLEICRKELMCDVEMEFAADVIPESKGSACVLKLLQVRPISEFAEDRNASAEAAEKEMGQMLVRSSKALGAGRIAGMRHIMYVPPKRFDNARTKEMRDEIARFNEKMKAEDSNYLLVGPGRWGSSDPWLGIPVVWSDISEAKMIVECAIPGYQIEPSQGTHFFQNITSFGVGYLTIDTVNRDGEADFDALDSLPAVDEGEYVRLIALDAELVAVIDRKSGQAVVGL